MQEKIQFDLIVIGSGAAGMIAAIVAAKNGKKVLLLEKLSKLGSKLKATGGGRCNLTNTLDNETFMQRFGRDGRFMTPSLKALDYQALMKFFKALGVESHAPDGYRVFPITHNANTIIEALHQEMLRLEIDIICKQRAIKLKTKADQVIGVETTDHTYDADHIIIATGGLGYPTLGAEGDGYRLAKAVGHTITSLHPAMMPLITKEKWVANCRADTIPQVELRVDLKKAKKLRAKGDLIFTKEGIRGPVVLDFAREVTPLLEKYGEVPLLLNLTKGMNEEQIRQHLKQIALKTPEISLVDLVATLLPKPLSQALIKLANINPLSTYAKVSGQNRDTLIKLLAWTPLTITGHDGFKMAMITRGGIKLKEINPETMQSRICKGLYFCGEVMDLDGPCGGYNLQWSFASGYLAGHLYT
ncbi:MAG: NAD(P)/FAD-dependent oxidoreductase [Epsilonproteobacteria bacterium]|nr:NAD(P)/FAD-dependent oxidoreductase [Campylobacterota bacterium]